MGSGSLPVRCQTENSIRRLLNSIAGVQSGLLGLSFGLRFTRASKRTPAKGLLARPPNFGGCFPEPEISFVSDALLGLISVQKIGICLKTQEFLKAGTLKLLSSLHPLPGGGGRVLGSKAARLQVFGRD